MSFFDKILIALGLKKKEEPKAGSPKPSGDAARHIQRIKDYEAKPAEMPAVDVVSMLERKAAATPQELNWKVSIVDLLKLLELDSSSEARKELAMELGCPPDLMDDSAQMNTWLHKTVLKKIAENGGNIPKELL
ncbi:MAG TPA: DUF3597 domain-containing protein [Anaerolineales bacterium]|jgi:hypothetical protein